MEQKRAVVRDRSEARAATLLQQLNAIRNAKAGKRREAGVKKRAAAAKKAAAEAAWRDK